MKDDFYHSTNFINIDFSLITKKVLLEKIYNYSYEKFQYIVTANADHVVRLPYDNNFLSAYSNADITTCDSQILKALSKISGDKLGELITGSDLTRQLIESISDVDIPLIIIGSDESDVVTLIDKYKLKNVSHYNPPMGFIREQSEVEKCINFLESRSHGIVLICVGSPQQEILALKIKETSKFNGVALCVGASINFLTGKVNRAPKLLQLLGLEWAYRLAKEPKRLFYRYFKCLYVFPMFFKYLINNKC